MKNVVAILIDSLFSDCLSNGRTSVSSSPFIDKLLDNSIFASNIYSYAPYTDAAAKGLFCSMPTMSEFGYYFGINGSSINPYKIFKENGYETFGIYYPYYLISPKIEQYIDHSIYSTGFVYYGTWRGQFEYYAEKMKKTPLTNDELMVIKKCVELIFDSWELYLNNVLNKNECRIILDSILPGDITLVKEALDNLCSEKIKFMDSPSDYIGDILNQGMNHALAKIDPYDINLFANHDYLENVYLNNSNLLKKAQKKNFLYNLRNNHFSFSKALMGGLDYLRTKDPYDLKYPINYLLGLNTIKSVQTRSFKPDWKYKASARRQVEVGIQSLKNRDPRKPFYIFLHFLDVHQNINFFSFDLDDVDRVSDEFQYMKPMIEGVDKSFIGSLGYQMAINYTDYCIKLLYDELEKLKLTDDTIIALFADHGSSYTYYPVRKRTVNCFHRENHKIPFILWDKKLTQKKCINGMHTSADIYATLYDYLGFKNINLVKGCSMLKNNSQRDYVITEYMGPGCPDMFTRDVWMSIRSENYLITFKSSISNPFNRNAPHQLFDLKTDPLEKKNLARKQNLSSPDISQLIDLVERRFNEIRNERDLFLSDLREGKIHFS